MTSPKVTFRRRGRAAIHASRHAHWGIQEPGDETLPAELRELVQIWREIYMGYKPRMQDIRATLQALAVASDQGARQAVGAIDSLTEARLVTAALRAFRRIHGAGAPISSGELDTEAWSVERIRAMAQSALEQLPRSRGGRPTTWDLNLDFMRALLWCWPHSKLEPVTPVQRARARVKTRYRSFARFARAMFALVGHKLKPRQLRDILAAADSFG